MLVNEKFRSETLKVVLESGVDFNPKDCQRFFDETFEIKEDKLHKIAKAIGFDECVRCSKLTRITQQFVNAEFIRYL